MPLFQSNTDAFKGFKDVLLQGVKQIHECLMLHTYNLIILWCVKAQGCKSHREWRVISTSKYATPQTGGPSACVNHMTTCLYIANILNYLRNIVYLPNSVLP